MGSDDLFHKRRAWNIDRHRRRKAQRSPYDRVLIVCEGEKTEPNYFEWLRNEFRLNRANVVIAHRKSGLDPKHAIAEYNTEKDSDHVYCVFDRDKLATYHAALDKIRPTRLKGGAQLHGITSIPYGG